MRSIERSRIVTFAPEPDGDHGRVVADDPAADHEHLARGDAGDSAEQQATAAERLLEEVAPAWAARRPATSLIGASSGSAPFAVSTVS